MKTSAHRVERHGPESHVRLTAAGSPCKHRENLVCFDVSCRHCGAALRDHVPVDEIRRAVLAAIDAHPCTRVET